MDINTLSSPSQDNEIPQIESNELIPEASLGYNQVARSSSDDDDVPLRTRRPVTREAVKKHEGDITMSGHRDYRENSRERKDHASRDHNCVTNRQAPKPAPKIIEKKHHKKPGPRPWAAKPITKNDMVAKMEIIREIEGLWGKNFIKTYIPRCHRPLTKRGKVGKRSMYRDHEIDPKNWLPSVLKAILMIAKLTQSKNWLKKAIDDVVRYRIKNTGNRKPQLVTTDFDVIEDMLVKEWTVAYSFEIRYKHLLVNRKDQQETDEDIDHILGVGLDQVNKSEDDDDDDDDQKAEDIEDQAKVERDDSDEEDVSHGDLTGQCMDTSGYNEPTFYPVYAIRQQRNQQKPLKDLKYEPHRPPQETYGYESMGRGYDPTTDPWDRPIPSCLNHGGYGRYDAYGMSCENYGYRPTQYTKRDARGRQSSQHPPTRGMSQFPPRHLMGPPHSNIEYGYHERTENFSDREQFFPCSRNKHVRERYEQTPTFDIEPRVTDPRGYSSTSQGYRQISMGRESPEFEERIPSPNEISNLSNDAEEEAIDAELAAAELQFKIAQLRVKKAAMRKQQAKTA